MIRVGEHTIFLICPDGRSIPWDPAQLQERLEKILSTKVDQAAAYARDISLAAEMALTNRMKNNPAPGILTENLDDLVVHILHCAGLRSAAEEYRLESAAGASRIPLDRIRTFLVENLQLEGTMRERIPEKVFHTMKSIGADDTSPELALELGKHFLAVAAGKIEFNIKRPDFTPDKENTVRQDDFLARLTPGSAAFFEKRILKVNTVNLRIFPAIRLDVRLTGIATENRLIAPLTEMMLAPGFIQAARAADELCLAADAIFREHGHEVDIPAKVLLHLSDASVFTRDWMGCNSVESQERCAMNLCRAFASEMTRVPVKLTCN